MSKICPECGKSFNGSQGQKYCSFRCCKRHNRRAKEIKLAKKIKKGKVCAGCGVIFRAKGGEEYCKTCREKGVTWGIE